MKRTLLLVFLSICTCKARADSIEQVVTNALNIYASVCTNVLDRICKETNSIEIADVDAFYLAGWANATNVIPLLEQLIELKEREALQAENPLTVQTFSTYRKKRKESPAFIAVCLLPLDRKSLEDDIENNSSNIVRQSLLIQLGTIKFGSDFMRDSNLLTNYVSASSNGGIVQANIVSVPEIRDWVQDYMERHPSEQQNRYTECWRNLKKSAQMAKRTHDEKSFDLVSRALEQIGRPLDGNEEW